MIWSSLYDSTVIAHQFEFSQMHCCSLKLVFMLLMKSHIVWLVYTLYCPVFPEPTHSQQSCNGNETRTKKLTVFIVQCRCVFYRLWRCCCPISQSSQLLKDLIHCQKWVNDATYIELVYRRSLLTAACTRYVHCSMHLAVTMSSCSAYILLHD